ncbi:MAG: ATP-binding protein [Halobacteria archaeon]
MEGGIDVLNIHEIGMIIGEASSSEFYFSTKPEEMPSRWEYLLVYSQEDIDGVLREVPVVAQVERIISASQALTKELDFEIIKKIVESGLVDKKTWGRARILGFLNNGSVLQPRRAVAPGKPVYLAPAEHLEKFYSYPKGEAIHIGSLITRSEVSVSLSIKGFRRHLAIIAQTGAGKSYAAGVLVEELIARGATIIILDPHADYVFLSRDIDNKKHEFSDRVTVFRNPMSTGRYSEAEIGKVEPYEICFSDLGIDEICLISRISDHYVNIINGVEEAIERVRRDKAIYLPRDLLEQLQKAETWEVDDEKIKGGAKSAQKYIKRLMRMQICSSSTTSIDKMLKPMQVSIVDLSGLEDEISDYIACKILLELYDKIANAEFQYPVFIFIEEAHRFIPPDENTYSSSIIKRIAAEGRKFGIFLVLITQRPSKIHSDVLSQCNSQIIMRITNPEDQNAIESSSERISKDLLSDLPGLNVGEAVIVGEMTRVPVMVKIRKRRTREGGADIDVVGKLKEAVEQVKNEDKGIEELRGELTAFIKSIK